MADAGRHAWRTTLKRRLAVAAGVLALWVGGIEARLVYLQVVRARRSRRRAPSGSRRARSRRAGQARRHPRSPRPRARDQRRRRHDLRRADRDRRRRGRRRASCARALGDCTAKERQALVERLGKQRAFAYVRRQVVAGAGARASPRSNLDGIGFIKESRRFYPNKELAAHLLGYVGIDNNGLSGLECDLRLADPRQGRHGARPDRRAAPRVQPRRAAADRRRRRSS